MAKRGGPPAPIGRAHVVVQEQTTTTTYQGPVPPPDVLSGYEQILNGGADRLLAMAEREQRNRLANERIAVLTGAATQVFGAALPAAGLVVSYFMAELGMNGASIASILSSVGYLTVRMIVNRKPRAPEIPAPIELPMDGRS